MIGLSFRELLPPGVDLELDAVLAAVNATIEQEHDGDTGEHTAITCDSISARGDTIPVSGNLRFRSGAWLFDEVGNGTGRSVIRPPQLTASVNNWNPSYLSSAFGIEVDADADRTITGIERGQRQRRLLLFANISNYVLTLPHDSASSLYYNRFGLSEGSDLVIPSSAIALLWYSPGAEVWRGGLLSV